MKNKAKILIELDDLNVRSEIKFEDVNQKGMAMLMAHIKYLLNRIERKFEATLTKLEEDGR